MKEDLNKFDDAFKKGLEGQEFEPSSDLWANISKGVEAHGDTGLSSTAGDGVSSVSSVKGSGSIVKFTAFWKTIAIIGSATAAIGTVVLLNYSNQDLSVNQKETTIKISEKADDSLNQELKNTKSKSEDSFVKDADTTELFGVQKPLNTIKENKNNQTIKSGDKPTDLGNKTLNSDLTVAKNVTKETNNNSDLSKDVGQKSNTVNEDNILSRSNDLIVTNEVLKDDYVIKDNKKSEVVSIDPFKEPSNEGDNNNEFNSEEYETLTSNNPINNILNNNSNKDIFNYDMEVNTSKEEDEDLSLNSISIIERDYMLTEQNYQEVLFDTTLITENDKDKNKFLLKTPWEPVGMYFDIGIGASLIHQSKTLSNDNLDYGAIENDEFGRLSSLQTRIGYQHKTGFLVASGVSWSNFYLSSLNKIIAVENDLPINDEFMINSYALTSYPVEALDYFTYEWNPDELDWDWKYEESEVEIDIVFTDWIDIYTIPLSFGYRQNLGRFSLYGIHSVEYNKVTYSERKFYFEELRDENYMGVIKNYNGENYFSSMVELGLGFKLSSQLELKGTLMARTFYSSFLKDSSLRSPKFLGSNISLRFSF